MDELHINQILQLMNQFANQITNHQTPYAELLTTFSNKIIAALKSQYIDINQHVYHLESQINLLELVINDQNKTISENENEIARLNSILNNNNRNSGFTRRTTVLRGAIRKQEADEQNVDDIDEYGFTISEKESEDNKGCCEGDDKKYKSVNKYNDRVSKGIEDDNNDIRLQGGQFNHQGKTMTKADAEKAIEVIKRNGGSVSEIQLGIAGKGKPKVCYLIGLKFGPFINKYIIYKDENGKYPYPSGLERNPVVYDKSIYAYVTYLRYECNIPERKISNIISDFSQGIINLSVGTIDNILKRFTKISKASFEHLEQQALQTDILNTDATYVFLNGKHSYIRNLSSKDQVLYYGLLTKGYDELNQISTFKEYNGILCHDHEILVYKFGKDEHGECIVHIIRYCRKNTEDSHNDWSKELISFFRDWQKEKEDAIARGEHEFSLNTLKQINEEYDKIVNKGWEQHKNTKGEYVIDREKAFLTRLTKYKKHHLLYLFNFNVDWTNNLSERDLRAAKRFSLVTGAFRCETGLKDYCHNLSIIKTIRRKKMLLLDSIMWLFDNEGNIFDPSVVKSLKIDR